MITRAWLLVLAFGATACATSRSASVEPAAAAAPVPSADGAGVRVDGIMGAVLVAYLEDEARPVSQATIDGQRVWTDQALLERGGDLPPPIREHLERSPPGPIEAERLALLLARVEAGLPNASRAQLVRENGTAYGCSFVAGAISARTNCVYANYVEARYPDATFLVTDKHAPIAIVMKGVLRALLMPVE